MNSDEIIWKIVKNYPDYFVSNTGLIKRNNKILKPHICRGGYLRLELSNRKTKKKFYVHRLVLETFVMNTDNKLQCNHINCDKTDNRLENLEWCTASENIKHSYRNGDQEKRRESNRLNALRNRWVQCKLIEITDPQNTIWVFESINEAAKVLNLDCSNLAKVAKGKYEKTKGYSARLI